MVIAPVILLASSVMVADLEWPSTRRVILPANRRSTAIANAYVGEGIVDLEIRRPAANISAALNGQLGRIIEKFEVTQDDVDLYKARLFTRVKYPAVKVLPIRSGKLLIDVTVNPEALTPTEAITPPVVVLNVEENGFPLPERQYKATSVEGQRILRALDRGFVQDARIRALDESPLFLSEVLTEIVARKAVTDRVAQPKINVEKLPLPSTVAGKLMWTVAAISVGLYAEADEVLRDLRKLKEQSIEPYIALYQTEIERRLGRKKVTVTQLKKIIRDGRDYPNHFAERAVLMGVRIALQNENLKEAISLLNVVSTPTLKMWNAELNYIAGRKGRAIALYRKVAKEPSTKLWGELRLVDLDAYPSKEAAEAILFRLNDRAENEVVSMLARARLLERGVLTKSFENTLTSLAHLAASNIAPVSMDAEMRIGRLNARAGRPNQSFQAFLRAETHAQDSMSRARIRARTFDGMAKAVDQFIRWRKEAELVMFANDFEELLPLHPDGPKLMLEIAIAARHVGNTALAVNYLVKVAKRDDQKNNDLVLAQLIGTYLQDGDLARARTIVAYADESQRTKRSAPLHRAKAEVLNRTGNPKEAVKHFMRAAQLGRTVSERSDDLARAADIALDHDMFGTAKQALTKMLFREKLSTQRKTNVRIDLATVYIKEGKPKSAVQLLKNVRTSSVANRTPDALVAQASYFEGEALFRMGKYEEARKLWLSRSRGTTHWDEFCRSAAQAAEVAAKIEGGIQ